MSFQAQFSYFLFNNTSSGALAANTRKDILSLEHAFATGWTRFKRVIRVEASWQATSAVAGDLRFYCYRGSAASTGGTAQAANPKHPGDSSIITTELVAKVNPTIVAATLLWAHVIGTVPATANSVISRQVLYDWSHPREDDMILRPGLADSLVFAIQSNAALTWLPYLIITYVEE